MENLLGVYEKALPKHISWHKRLEMASQLEFDFLEISIDETDERLSRLYWSKEQKYELVRSMHATGIPILTMCFSGHRRFPLGSHNSEIRDKAIELMERAVEFAFDTGIRVVQLAGYDVYYEKSDLQTKQYFLEGLRKSIKIAEKYQVMLAVEIMDTPFLNSIRKYLRYNEMLGSPWFTVYPDLGNLSAWGNNVELELEKGINRIVAIHVKDTLPVTDTFEGKFKDVGFGDGCVDFPTAFKKLKSLGYKGSFLIEMWSEKAEDPIAEVAKAKRWVEARLEEGGFRC
jgi:L-ribulose-5-phosphate 3-epimerase